MEVKDANAAMLSNYEVFKLLTDLKEQRKESGNKKHSAGQQNLNTIMYETLKYLSKTPCKHQTPEIVKEFLTAMLPQKLTKSPTDVLNLNLNSSSKSGNQQRVFVISVYKARLYYSFQIKLNRNIKPEQCLNHCLHYLSN
ncbi:DNA-directed RNA polymerase III subunit RPC9 isoform X3 [Scyliorhinus canicula]|uniref:DNA-directed RNA polymerase III subunit RPC9 isoform X3 n=1 Tax=Scyliorhinus canicula TaxID=7830 RepID=UPI0018F2B63C|nr:DNA-directed RNA polymerase III subunit RPC9 isoform X3 [Scyliorhinus canicula]